MFLLFIGFVVDVSSFVRGCQAKPAARGLCVRRVECSGALCSTSLAGAVAPLASAECISLRHSGLNPVRGRFILA